MTPGFAKQASTLLSGAVGAVLLALILSPDREAAPTPEPKPDPKPQIIQPKPQPKQESVAMAAIALPEPPPPAPEPVKAVAPLKPQPAPEPAVVVEPMKPAPKAQPEPAKVVEPLKPKAETPPPAPEKIIKPLAVKPKPEPNPEPAKTVKALKPKPKPKPKPAPKAEAAAKRVQALKPEPKPVPKKSANVEKPKPKPVTAAAKPKPKPVRTREKTVNVTVSDAAPEARTGRALLRLLEHGDGPGIEIAWPRGHGARQALHRLLSGCYGMRSVVMDAKGNLFVAEGGRGRRWAINLDRYSGFVRMPSGSATSRENRETSAIRRYHGMRGGAMVRIFPRKVDAVLLGGLQSILGERYKQARVINADYRQTGSGLFIENIRADGKRAAGRIAFAGVSQGKCR